MLRINTRLLYEEKSEQFAFCSYRCRRAFKDWVRRQNDTLNQARASMRRQRQQQQLKFEEKARIRKQEEKRRRKESAARKKIEDDSKAGGASSSGAAVVNPEIIDKIERRKKRKAKLYAKRDRLRVAMQDKNGFSTVPGGESAKLSRGSNKKHRKDKKGGGRSVNRGAAKKTTTKAAAVAPPPRLEPSGSTPSTNLSAMNGESIRASVSWGDA